MTIQKKARLLLQEVNEALERGTKHYHPRTGELLVSNRAIIGCLMTEGKVVFEPVKPAELSKSHVSPS